VITLYLDSSFGIGFGLLDADCKLINYSFINEKKQSAVIHRYIYDILKENGFTTKDITNIVITAGPGSYTGMRLSSGISQIFEWQNIKVNSFYHFEVPALLGENLYVWTTKAFKSESFCYIFDNGQSQKLRVKENDTEKFLEDYVKKGYKIYTFAAENIYSNIDMRNSKSQLENNLASICEQVISNNKNEELYYFRSIEEEFKPSVKIL
jgi:tRNA threonylcarbamoyladenosine biosynthesis protein TsaB